MSASKMTVESFTCSTMIEIHRSGEKTQHFVSATVKLDPGISLEEWPLQQLLAAYKISVAAVHDALMRGVIGLEDANARIEAYKNNYEVMKGKIEPKPVHQTNGVLPASV